MIDFNISTEEYQQDYLEEPGKIPQTQASLKMRRKCDLKLLCLTLSVSNKALGKYRYRISIQCLQYGAQSRTKSKDRQIDGAHWLHWTETKSFLWQSEEAAVILPIPIVFSHHVMTSVHPNDRPIVVIMPKPKPDRWWWFRCCDDVRQ